MSLASIVQKFRKIAITEFIAYCEKGGSDIDMVMLEQWGVLFCKESLDCPAKSRKGPPGVKATKKKKDVITGDGNFERMPSVVVEKCMARTFAKGVGTQCTRKTCEGSEDYCTRHMKSAQDCHDKSELIPAFGRIDRPRCECRFDTRADIGWRLWNGDGPVEIEDDGVGVGGDVSCSDMAISETEKMTVGGEGLDIDNVVSSLNTQKMVKSTSVEVVESPKSVENDNESAPEEEKVVEEAVKDAVNEVVKKVVEEEEEVGFVIEAEKIEEDKEEEEVGFVIEAEKIEEDKEVVEKEEELLVVEKKFPKMGKYQGVRYRFAEENIHGEHPVQLVDWSNMSTTDVGTWNGDELIWNEDFDEDSHDMQVHGDLQEDEEVIWE